MKNYTIGLYEKAMPINLSFAEKLQCVKDTGFDFLEISIDETDEKLSRLDMSKNDRQEIKNLVSKIGIPIDTMCLSGHRKYPLGSQEYSKKSMEIMEKAIILAHDLGIRIIQLAGYDVYYTKGTDETRKLFIENLKKSVMIASKHGVMLGFETMETEFMNTVEKSMEYVKMVNSPYLGIYPDIGNLSNAAISYKKDVIDDIKIGKGHIIAMHLKETVLGKYREIPYGTGHTRFKEIISQAQEMGINKFVAEFWYVGQENWLDDIIFANKFIKEKF